MSPLLSKLRDALRMPRKKNVVYLNLLLTGHEFAGKSAFKKTLEKYLQLHSELPEQLKCPIDDPLVYFSVVEAESPEEASNLLQAFFEATLLAESQIKRGTQGRGLKRRQKEKRIDLTLYFLDPSQILNNQGVSMDDIHAIRQLTDYSNVMLVISKGDYLTTEQRTQAVNLVREAIQKYKPHIWATPEDGDYADFEHPEDHPVPQKEHVPGDLSNPNFVPLFCLINGETNENGEQTFLRHYPWGSINVLDEKHSDFLTFFTYVTAYAYDLHEATRIMYYEPWRTTLLLHMPGLPLNGSYHPRECIQIIAKHFGHMDDVKNVLPRTSPKAKSIKGEKLGIRHAQSLEAMLDKYLDLKKANEN